MYLFVCLLVFMSGLCASFSCGRLERPLRCLCSLRRGQDLPDVDHAKVGRFDVDSHAKVEHLFFEEDSQNA
jgi:hypothetical protein